MILRELLAPKPISDDTYIYLGTQLGVSWIWICQKKDLEERANYFSQTFHEAKQKEYDKKKAMVEQMECDINALETEINELQTRFLKKKKQDESLKSSINDKTVEVNGLKHQYENTKLRVDYLYDYLDQWTDMLDRNIVELGPHTNGEAGLGVVIEGDEGGRYWFLHEVQEEKTPNVKINNFFFTTKRSNSKSA